MNGPASGPETGADPVAGDRTGALLRWPSGLATDWLDWNGRTGRPRFVLFLAVAGAAWAFCAAVLWLGVLPEPLRVAVTVLAALLLYPVAGYSVRRFHDMGRTGLLAFWVFVPVVGLPVLAWQLLAPSDPKADPELYSAEWAIGGLSLLSLFVLLALSRIAWQPFHVTDPAMKPTLLIGDVVIGTRALSMPAPNELVVFRHPATGRFAAGRVVGLPGDTVQMRAGLLYINGRPAERLALQPFVEPFQPQGPEGHWPMCANFGPAPGSDCLKHRFVEQLDAETGHAILDAGRGAGDDTEPFRVPAAHVFVIGDNRDNSRDSRLPAAAGGVGFLPVEEIAARARFVLFSSGASSLSAVWGWRSDRAFTPVQ